MPELPEVETMRRGILEIVGASIQKVERLPCKRKPIGISPRMDSFRRRVTGQTVRDVGRIGKRVIVTLESDDHMVFEPRMTGLVLIADPPSLEHLRFRVDLTGGPIDSFWYWDRRGLGSIYLLTDEELTTRLGPPQLGIDALSITAAQLRTALGKSQREIKPALLDQKAVAGIGNLYASEILHMAKVHPEKRCHQMSANQWNAVIECTRHILNEAIRYEGSTLSDGTYRNALNKEGGYQNEHRVYDREGSECPRCPGHEIIRIVQTQRSTFYCKNCQKKR